MGQIVVLDQNMVNMIAAGEVIERPTSVVKKLILFSVAVLVFCSTAFGGTEAQELCVKIERNVPVPMRDGTILRADIHRPDRGGPYPVLVQRTVYGKDGDFDRFVKAGYIVVSQDIRGKGASEGEGSPYWEGNIFAKDGYDTVEWAAKLFGSNGKVGTFGSSALAREHYGLAYLNQP